jgi:hypothetical protein
VCVCTCVCTCVYAPGDRETWLLRGILYIDCMCMFVYILECVLFDEEERMYVRIRR